MRCGPNDKILPMSDAVRPTVVPDALPCISCGRDLRGCALEGDCPGCGVAVERSIKDDLLRFADARWVHGLRLGTNTLLWSLEAAVGYVGLMFLSMILLRMIWTAAEMIQLGMAGVWLIVRLLWYIGVWRITAREPGGPPEGIFSLRRWLRRLLGVDMIGDAAFVLAVVIHSTDIGQTHPWNEWAISLKAFYGWLVPVPLVIALLLLWYLRRQVLRAPDRRLARHTLWFMIVFGIVATALVVVTMVWPAYQQAHEQPRQAGRTVLAAGCGMSALLGLLFVAWIVLLIRYTDTFRKSAGLSRY